MRWCVLLALLCAVSPAIADDTAFEAHAQTTYINQVKPGFRSPYEGANSLIGRREVTYSWTATLYLGARLANGTELYFNPEWVQSNPLSGLHGVGGFTNGEYQRGSGRTIKGYRARLFLRH